MPLAPRKSSIGNPRFLRAEFNLPKFIEEINNHGYMARWSKASLCPNRDPDQDDHHKIDCTLCSRNGFIYFSPIEIKVLVSAFGTKQAYVPESRYEPGMAYFTTTPDNKLNFWDKIELLNSRARYTEVVKIKSLARIYTLRYPALQMEYIITNAGINIGLDTVAINDNGQLVFSVVPPGNFVAVSYLYHPTYIMLDLLHHMRDSRITEGGVDIQADFPVQAMGKLEFLVGND